MESNPLKVKKMNEEYKKLKLVKVVYSLKIKLDREWEYQENRLFRNLEND